MDKWQAIRLNRAKQQDLQCANFTFTDDSAVFWIVGLTDQYEVEVNQHVDLWPPSCSCEDNAWRDVLCKHILFVLRGLGAQDEDLADCCWEPAQHELYEYLSNAPDCVTYDIAAGRSESQRRQSVGHAPDSQVGAR